MRTLIITLLFALLFASPVFAQGDFSNSSISDTALQPDFTDEALPTVDRLRFGWENFLFNIRRVFTFNAERKAELDRTRLHRLDRKLAACSQIGDQECFERIQERIEHHEAIAQKHIDKYEELQDKFADRLEEWRESRKHRIQALRQRIQQQAKPHQEAIERSQQQPEQTPDLSEPTLEQRQQNQEHLIEVRSQHLKKTLDDARGKVELHSEVRTNADANVETNTSLRVNGEEITEDNDDD